MPVDDAGGGARSTRRPIQAVAWWSFGCRATSHVRAAVEWSYSLLDEEERQVFDAFAVFAGGTLIEGLAQVTGLDEFDAIDVVDRLVARSMVVATETPLGMRYSQLETLRQFAEDRLVDTGTFDDVRNQHLAWVVTFATGLPARGSVEEVRSAFKRFVAEVDNLRIAVAHALVGGKHSTAQHIVAAVQPFAYNQPVWEVLDWVRPVTIDNEWTDDAAECAAVGAYVDYRRGRETADTPTLGGVPERFLVTNPRIANFQALFLRTPGGWQGIRALLSRFEPVDEYRFLVAARGQIFLAYMRQFVEELEADEIDALVALCESAAERARRIGAPIELVSTLFLAGYALMVYRPDLAVPFARESASVAAAIGADYLTEYANTAVAVTLIRSAGGNVSDVHTLAELRGVLAETISQKHFHDAGVLAIALIPTLAVADPEVAALVGLTFSRHSSIDMSRDFARAGLPVPDHTATSNARVANITFADALEAAVAVLDRMIAARSRPVD